MRVELAYVEGCPHWRDAEAVLLALQPELGFELTHRIIGSPADAVAHGFAGSPSITVDGTDLFDTGDLAVGFTCRRYETPAGPAGSPTLGQVREALTSAQGDRG